MKRARGYVLVPLFTVVLAVGAQSPPSDRAVTERTHKTGYWKDLATGLMWAGKDNGRDVTWQKAMKYCRDLRLAGYSDWRLATLGEMQGIYDKDAKAPGLAGEGKTLLALQLSRKGQLFLSGNQWTSSIRLDDRGKPSGYAWRFDFLDGRAFGGDEYSFRDNKRALCVRGSSK